MGDFASLMEGFATALQPMYLLYALIGVTLGTAVGVLPGIGPAMTVALLLPLTYTVEPVGAFIMFAGIYYGGMYGGSTTSILLNTPGESSSIVTALEGNKMALSGRGAAALATAAIGSFVAGTIATIGLTIAAPTLADLAVQIGPPDYVALTVVALLTVSALLGTSVSRGVAALGIGLFVGLIGTESLTGQQRFTGGLPVLADGIDVVTFAVGVFAVGEALWVASRLRRGPLDIIPVSKGWMTREDFRRSWKPWLRGTALGFPIGAMPAGGAEIPTFLSYATEKKLSDNPEEFGQGAIEGVAGPEAANNAAAAGVLVPLLTLGLPTSATAAVLIAAFQSYGIQPGPLLFATEGALVWALIASLYIGNVMLLLLNLPLVGLWVKLLQVPRPYLYAGILLFSALGGYALNGVRTDLWVLLAVGVLGYLMRRFGYPVGPAVIGLILGPISEEQIRAPWRSARGMRRPS
ncbi:tripartite tricarboxylate transporter permease [Nocardioides sp.]|uniref:tripartite tricarboxylate transporter permease n=1 Tax=Nocardioides sp. TaxID=35761 RepID=UPI002B268934|nr:tripartite tricarboxylate transporter permease [Nocardioides sp.]